jgi:phosphate transport system substrate-binding protein
VPLVEAPVAIAINTHGFGTIHSALTPPSGTTVPGQAIQLTTAQICAIFSGTVNDWSSTTSIAGIDNSGSVSMQSFDAANLGSASGSPVSTATPYASTSLPIRVVYRSDNSGTSFIMLNYLRSVCPQLDYGSNGYASIFGHSSLPSNSFSALINRIRTVKSINVLDSGYNGGNPWIGRDGSAAVAEAINNVANDGGSTTYSGRIGYISAAFTQPYQFTQFASFAPLSASVQNEAQRVVATVASDYLPASTSGGTNPPTFIAPTPGGADLAFSGLSVPASPSTHNDWNLYAQFYPLTTLSGGLDISGKSRLGIPTTTDAYPIVGTTFALLYSCYKADGGTTPRVTRIKDFLNWIYTSVDASSVIDANGFSPLTNSGSPSLRSAALNVVNGIEAAGTGACSGKVGG